MDFLNKHLRQKAKDHQDKRKKFHGDMFTASDAGLCVGKSWHRREGTEQKLPEDKALIMMKLGDLIHNIIQDAAWGRDPGDAMIEFFMKDEKLKVCGSLDLYLNSEKHLIDIKTVHSYKYSLMFGRNKDKNPSEHHEMQLGTYGMMLEDAGHAVERISILYVNRNDGRMQEKNVNLNYIQHAQDYWETINLEMEYGPEGYDDHFMLPVYDWECKYCSFADNCKWRKEDNAKKQSTMGITERRKQKPKRIKT